MRLPALLCTVILQLPMCGTFSLLRRKLCTVGSFPAAIECTNQFFSFCQLWGTFFGRNLTTEAERKRMASKKSGTRSVAMTATNVQLMLCRKILRRYLPSFVSSDYNKVCSL
uniref:Putative secreted protein n=1 Tax=Ixodes ricinus TaxID=34613 RepID=A0A6B0UJP9_IXORI